MNLSTVLGERDIAIPKLHVVLGSGFGAAMEAVAPDAIWEPRGEIAFSEISGFLQTTVSGHSGQFIYWRHRPSGKTIVFQSGRVHGYEGHSAAEVVQTVIAARLAGTERFVLTNAAGGMKQQMKPGDVMVIEDHVNFTGQNPLIGKNPVDQSGRQLGPRFPDMSDVYDKSMSAALSVSMKEAGLKAHRGVYLGLLGPSFETPAEIRLFSQWGLDAVGMSTVWEAIALRHSGAKVSGLSLISNLACGMTSEVLNHENILETSKAAALKIITGLFHFAHTELSK